jgi:hypothetical protein
MKSLKDSRVRPLNTNSTLAALSPGTGMSTLALKVGFALSENLTLAILFYPLSEKKDPAWGDHAGMKRPAEAGLWQRLRRRSGLGVTAS